MTSLLTFSICILLVGFSMPQASGSRQVTCFECPANTTKCTKTCTGAYCYKIVAMSDPNKLEKRGCVKSVRNSARVQMGCVDVPNKDFPGEPYIERKCICNTEKCNGAPSFLSTVGAAATATITILALIF